MFPARYFAARYFAPRYWPKVGGSAPGETGTGTVFRVPDRPTTFAAPDRPTTFLVRPGGPP